MKKQALILGLTAVLFAFVFTWIGERIFGWLNFQIPFQVMTVAMLAASYLLARALGNLMEGEDEPPPALGALLMFSAGFFLSSQLISGLGVSFGAGTFSETMHFLTQWALVGTCLFTTRYIKPRIMLFLGVSAFAMEFHAAMVLGMFQMRLPEWLSELITFFLAVLIARWLCLSEVSPADRVGNPLFLWLFSATGTMSLIISVHETLLASFIQQIVWVGFLVSFLLLVRQIEPDDPDHKNAESGPPFTLMFLVFVGLFSAVSSVFRLSDIVDHWMPFTASGPVQLWLPIIVNAVVAAAILVLLQLNQRVRPDAPGRIALFCGVILYFIGVLAGGSIFGVVSSEGRFFEFLTSIYWLILLVVPIMVAAQVLMGIGLLRILFNLDERPESRA
jgi:hypothetical protein